MLEAMRVTGTDTKPKTQRALAALEGVQPGHVPAVRVRGPWGWERAGSQKQASWGFWLLPSHTQMFVLSPEGSSPADWPE